MKKLIIAFCAVFLVACNSQSSLSGGAYSREDAREPAKIMTAKVVDIRHVQIEGTKSSIGGTVGTILGSIAGAGAGRDGGRTQAAATVIAGTIGAILGGKAEEAMTKVDGIEVTVEEADGTVMAYVQEVIPEEKFYIGQTVRISKLNGTYRVTPYTKQ